MSAIRPNLPAITPQGGAQGPAPASLKQAQAAFFRAALGEVQAAPLAQTTAQTSAPARATVRSEATAPDGARPLRPGSLLDIKV